MPIWPVILHFLHKIRIYYDRKKSRLERHSDWKWLTLRLL